MNRNTKKRWKTTKRSKYCRMVSTTEAQDRMIGDEGKHQANRKRKRKESSPGYILATAWAELKKNQRLDAWDKMNG